MISTLKLHPIAGCTSHRTADVIFIHGLGGDPFETWRYEDFFWPEALGRDFEQVGIWSLGYPAAKSDWLGSAMPLADRALNTLTLLEAHDIGKLPVFFVVHSLGGLLVKQMLRHAGELGQSSWLSIRNATKAIAFLATPNNGSRLANWTNFWTVLRPSAAMQDLELNDSRLRELNLWFRNNVHTIGCQLVIFYERLPTGPVIVVDEASSDPGVAGVIPIPLDENHASICKPASTAALQYMRVKRMINDLLPKQSVTNVVVDNSQFAATPPRGCILNMGSWRPNEINFLAFSPCSRYLAVASDDGTIRVWRAGTEDLLLTILAHNDSVKALCWSPDGACIASCSADGDTKLWSFPNGKLRQRWMGDDDWVRAITWSANGRWIASGYANGSVRIFSPDHPEACSHITAHEGRVRAIAASPCSRLLASGGADGLIAVWNIEDCTRQASISLRELFHLEEQERAQVICIAWSPSGEYLIAGTISGHVALIDTLTFRIIRAEKLCRDSVLCVCWSPLSDEVAVGSSDRTALRIKVSELEKLSKLAWFSGIFGATSKRVRKVTTHSGSVRAVAWSPDGTAIATGSTDETIRFHSGIGYIELRAHQLRMRCAALSNDSRFLALGSIARTVTLFDLQTGTHQWTFEGTSEVVATLHEEFGKDTRLVEKRREGLDEYARCVSFSRNSKLIAVGCDDRTVRILNVRTGRCDGQVLSDCHPDPIHCLAWSPDDQFVLSCSSNVVALWDFTATSVQKVRAHRGRILAAAWAPSGRAFATTGEDKIIILWQTFTPRELCVSPSEITLLSWSPDGKFIIGAGPADQVCVWNAEYGQLVAQVPTEGGARSLTWTAAECMIALDHGDVLIVEQGTWKIRSRIDSLPATHRSLGLHLVDFPIQPNSLVLPELYLAVSPLTI